MITYKTDPNFYLFLDDERSPNKVFWIDLPKNVPWVIVRNYKQFKQAIETRGIPAFVTFDHDLADEHYSMTSDEVNSSSYEEVVGTYQEKTGYDCLKWLVGKVLAPIGAPFPDYALHTMNSIGKDNMEKYINTYKRYLLSGK
jgi:hypothetical protein